MTLGAEFADILRAAQAGAEWAVTRLYREFNTPLVRFLDARAPGLGEDLAQEVWLGVAPKLAAFEGDEAQFRGFLFTVAHRRLVSHWRHSGRRPSTPTTIEQLDRLEASATDDDELSARAAIAELVDGLSDEQTEIVLLRVLGGLSVDEVAAIVGKRAGTVRVIQHRALRKIADRLGQKAVTP